MEICDSKTYLEMFEEFKKKSSFKLDDIEEIDDRTERTITFFYKEWIFNFLSVEGNKDFKNHYFITYSNEKFTCKNCCKLYRAPFSSLHNEYKFPENISGKNLHGLPVEEREKLNDLFNAIIFNEKVFPLLEKFKEEDEQE